MTSLPGPISRAISDSTSASVPECAADGGARVAVLGGVALEFSHFVAQNKLLLRKDTIDGRTDLVRDGLILFDQIHERYGRHTLDSDRWTTG